MVNAKKIAELANVSRSTVQRALSGNPKVAEKTRERVLAIANELGYSVNRPARALVMRQQNIEYSVVFSIPENKFYREVLRGIEKAREEISGLGVKIDVHFIERIEAHQQAQMLERLVNQRKKGIVFVPYDSKEVKEVVNWGTRQGTTFVSVISDIEETGRICFVGQNLYKSGLVAGNLMAKLTHSGDKIVCIVGSRSFTAHRDRLNGFTDRYGSLHNNGEKMDVLENYDSNRFSIKLMEEYLEKNPDIKGIYIAGGGVPGICDAVEKKGLTGEVRIISYDLIQSEEYCRRGLIDFVIDQDPIQEGYKALHVLNNYIMFDERPEDKVYTRVDIRTSDNLD
jgi:LacI family transcriptional regulator